MIFFLARKGPSERDIIVCLFFLLRCSRKVIWHCLDSSTDTSGFHHCHNWTSVSSFVASTCTCLLKLVYFHCHILCIIRPLCFKFMQHKKGKKKDLFCTTANCPSSVPVRTLEIIFHAKTVCKFFIFSGKHEKNKPRLCAFRKVLKKGLRLQHITRC